MFNNLLKRKIQKNGLESVGTIISIRQIGSFTNYQPEMEFTIVYSVGDKQITAVTNEIISHLDLHKLSEGTKVAIRYLKEHPEKIMLSK